MRLMGWTVVVWACVTAFAEGPHPVQGLDAFMERHGEKPYDLFVLDDGSLAMHRVIFEDKQFGTPVWMIDDSPTVEHAGTASIWPAWNMNASALYLEGVRPWQGEAHPGWFCNADYSHLRPAQGERPAVWSPDDPAHYYAPQSPTSGVSRFNWRTGEQEVVAEWETLSWPASGQRIYGLTRDGRHIFVDLPNRGIWAPFTVDDDHPIPLLSLYDGRPIGPKGEPIGSNHFCVIYDHDEFGDLIALRTGMLIDRETGEQTNIVAPLCGNTNYLRAFHEGRVHYPEGEEWNACGLPGFAEEVRLPTGLSMDELHDLWRSLPHATHGHESPSPDWEYIATDGGTTLIAHVRDGATEGVRLSPDGTNYHLHWRFHPRFFVGWVRGWHFGNYRRPENGNIVYQIFTDRTAQPVFDTNHRFNGYYAGGDFSMQSPDTTKIHTASSMTGRFRNYVAVMARPRPPEHLAWTNANGGVALEWEPSAYSAETRGYLVYRSERSGDAYKLLTREPVNGPSWVDESVEPGTAYFYVVTALEHSGLESGYSVEVARAGVGLPATVGGPLVVYAEAEEALWNLGTAARPGLATGVDRREASDWYFLYRHPEAEEGEAALTVRVPATDEYHLWARMRSGSGEGTWRFSWADTSLEGATHDAAWTWVRVSEAPVQLQEGAIAIAIATKDEGAALDLIALATDEGFKPDGPRPERTLPPAPIDGLEAENIRKRVNRLRWEASPDPGLSHYQVYAARQPLEKPAQKYLIGSPTRASFIDWGLHAGAEYFYAVTAVDRQGNESAPVFAQAATPPRETDAITLELAFAAAKLDGRFEHGEADGLRGPAFVVPEEPDSNRAEWEIEVPHDGTWYFWLRYLQRGSGRRGDVVNQQIQALLNGEPVATLGGGSTDLHVPDDLIAPGQPLAPGFWTWAWPGVANLEGVALPRGRHTLTLENLTGDVRYDVLLITDEPAFQPDDGRLRQNR